MALIYGNKIVTAMNISGMLANMFFVHGLIPVNLINNGIVRGGWFIGAIVIFYVLFPVLYKFYFLKMKFWRKYRVLIFPMVILVISILIISVLEKVDPFFRCDNNTFTYFSFINQLPAFSLGIVLFDLYEKNNNRNGKNSKIKRFIYKLLARGGLLYLCFYSLKRIDFLFLCSLF